MFKVNDYVKTPYGIGKIKQDNKSIWAVEVNGKIVNLSEQEMEVVFNSKEG